MGPVEVTEAVQEEILDQMLPAIAVEEAPEGQAQAVVVGPDAEILELVVVAAVVAGAATQAIPPIPAMQAAQHQQPQSTTASQ